MARRTIQQRIAQLDAQRKALEGRLSKQERTKDTRRKVLLGALVLQRLEAGHDPEFTRRLSDWLHRELPSFLTREADKLLFADLMAPVTPPGDASPGGQARAVEPSAKDEAA